MPAHTFPTMGTMASLIFADALPPAALLSAVEELFAEDDERFSLYRADSELSRLARRELTLPTASAALRAAYRDAADWRIRSNGLFTPERPDGVLDLSGIVKARTMERARITLTRAGVTDAVIDVGGDAVALGAHHGSPWRAGIVDPADRSRLLCGVLLTPHRGAIATSGTAERGEHVWRTGRAPFTQVSVLAADIVTADVLATAILAGTAEQCDDLCERFDVDVLTADRDGALAMTPGMAALASGALAATL